jgi:hypothetical protein
VPEFKEECGNLVRVAVNHDVAAFGRLVVPGLIYS